MFITTPMLIKLMIMFTSTNMQNTKLVSIVLFKKKFFAEQLSTYVIQQLFVVISMGGNLLVEKKLQNISRLP